MGVEAERKGDWISLAAAGWSWLPKDWKLGPLLGRWRKGPEGIRSPLGFPTSARSHCLGSPGWSCFPKIAELLLLFPPYFPEHLPATP